MLKLTILEGRYNKRTLSDINSFISNREIQIKLMFTINPVTRSSYKVILKNRAMYAIAKQPYFNDLGD